MSLSRPQDNLRSAKMTATIQHINMYDDGLVEIIVICNLCNTNNCHTITGSSTKHADKTTIDFSNLGTRCCHNYGKPENQVNTMCNARYNLYLGFSQSQDDS